MIQWAPECKGGRPEDKAIISASFVWKEVGLWEVTLPSKSPLFTAWLSCPQGNGVTRISPDLSFRPSSPSWSPLGKLVLLLETNCPTREEGSSGESV